MRKIDAIAERSITWLLGALTAIGCLCVVQITSSPNMNGYSLLTVFFVALIVGPSALGNALRVRRLAGPDSVLGKEASIAGILAVVFYIGVAGFLGSYEP